MSSAALFQIQSASILALLFLGVAKRKVRRIHIPIMSAVIAWDILLVLQIELGRGAIAKAAKGVANPLMLNIHVAIAGLTVLLYFALIYTGRALLAGRVAIRPKHRLLGMAAVVLRTLTFATSFFTVLR